MGDPHDEGVDLDRGDVRSGIETPVGRGGRPAAHPQDQHRRPRARSGPRERTS